MDNYKELVICIFLSVLVSSCSRSEPESAAIENIDTEKLEQPVINETIVNKKSVLQKTTKESILKQQREFAKRTVALNGEKFTYIGEYLSKGSEVFNLDMAEMGTMKGTFVVISSAIEIEEAAFQSQSKIAKDTYRLVPNSTDDLVDIYKQLLSNKSIERVEVEVVYSGKIKPRAEY